MEGPSSATGDPLHFLPQYQAIRAAVGTVPKKKSPEGNGGDAVGSPGTGAGAGAGAAGGAAKGSDRKRSSTVSARHGHYYPFDAASDHATPQITTPKDVRKMALFLECAQFSLLRLQHRQEIMIVPGASSGFDSSSRSATDNSEAKTAGMDPYAVQMLAWVNSTCIRYASQGLLCKEETDTEQKKNEKKGKVAPIKVFSVRVDANGSPLFTTADANEDPLELFQQNIMNLIEFDNLSDRESNGYGKNGELYEEKKAQRDAQMAALTHQHARTILTTNYPFHYLIELFIRQVTLYLRHPSYTSEIARHFTAQIASFISIMVQMMYWVHRRFSEQTLLGTNTNNTKPRMDRREAKLIRQLEETVIPMLSTAVIEVLDTKLSFVLLRWYWRKHSAEDSKIFKNLKSVEKSILKNEVKKDKSGVNSVARSVDNKPTKGSPLDSSSSHIQESEQSTLGRKVKVDSPIKRRLKVEIVKGGEKEIRSSSETKSPDSSSYIVVPKPLVRDSRTGSFDVDEARKNEKKRETLLSSCEALIMKSRQLERAGNRTGAYRSLTKAIGKMLQCAKIEPLPSARIELRRRVAELASKANMLQGKRGHYLGRPIHESRRRAGSFDKKNPSLKPLFPRHGYSNKPVKTMTPEKSSSLTTSPDKLLNAGSVSPSTSILSTPDPTKDRRSASAEEFVNNDLPCNESPKLKTSLGSSPALADGINTQWRPKEGQRTSLERVRASPLLAPSNMTKNASAPDLPSLLFNYGDIPVTPNSEKKMTPIGDDKPLDAGLRTDAADAASVKTLKVGYGVSTFAVPSSKFRLSTDLTKEGTDFPPAPTMCAPPAPTIFAPPPPHSSAKPKPKPKKQLKKISSVDLWKELGERLAPVIHSMRRFFEARTVQNKLSHLEDACMGIQNIIEESSVSADDLLGSIIICILMAGPEHLTGEANFLENISSIFFPEASLDHRGYCITTFLCAADYLKALDTENLKPLLAMVSKLFDLVPEVDLQLGQTCDGNTASRRKQMDTREGFSDFDDEAEDEENEANELMI
mmetsp:Transcript_26072/g.62804  ORF Transcript_26072/g.62804 Transcript_26072/m.62804 type:complete len:1033 (-) Transcript_26072:116-3214(-)